MYLLLSHCYKISLPPSHGYSAEPAPFKKQKNKKVHNFFFHLLGSSENIEK